LFTNCFLILKWAKDGTFPLILRITYYRKILKIPLGYCFLEKDWDSKNQRVKTTSKVTSNITRLNSILKDKQADIYNKVAQLDMANLLVKLSPKQLKNHLFPSDSTIKKNVYSYIDHLVDEKIKAGKKGSGISYRATKRKLQSIFGDSLISFEQITYQALKKIETEHLGSGGKIGGLGVYMRTLRAVYNRAIKDKLVNPEHYPFKDYKIKSADTERRALSEADFLKFKTLDLPPHLEKARDYFLASFYMRGMNHIDMANLKIANIEGDFDRIRYQRRKTGKHFSIKISDPLKTILLKYIENPSDPDAYIFPILYPGMSEERKFETTKNNRQRLNKKLKEIAKLHHLDSFTIYAARHTYATMGKRKGVPTAVIQESLGHKTEAITQTYLNSFENSVVDEYDKLIMG